MPRVDPDGHIHILESMPPDTTLPSGRQATHVTHLQHTSSNKSMVGLGRCCKGGHGDGQEAHTGASTSLHSLSVAAGLGVQSALLSALGSIYYVQRMV